MNCRGIERNLVSYLYGELSAWKQRRIERHLGKCDACRTLVEQTRTTRQLIGDLSEMETPEHLDQTILREANMPTTVGDPKPVRRPFVLRPAFGMAVVLVLAAGVVFTQTDYLTKKSVTPARQQDWEEAENLTRDRADKGDKGTNLGYGSEKGGKGGRERQRHLTTTTPQLEPKSPETLGAPRRSRPAESYLMVADEPRHDSGLQAVNAKLASQVDSQAVFLQAMETYNRAFQEPEKKRRTLFKEALEKFESISAHPNAGIWQVLATALCADIYRSQGDTGKAVHLYERIIQDAQEYQDYAREAHYALFKIYLDEKSALKAAQKEASAIIENGTDDARASHVSLALADRLAEDNPREAASWYQKARKMCPPNSPGYDRAEFALGSLQQRLAAENFILDWWIIGPFDDPEDKRLVTEKPPEREIDFSAKYKGAEGKTVRWKRLFGRTSEPPKHIAELERGIGYRFHDILEPDEHVSIYALTFVHVEEKTPVRLLIGSDDSVRCWINDEIVWSNPSIRGLSPNQDHVAATLKKGWNKVLLKVANNEGEWGFFFQIVDVDNQFLWDLEVDPKAFYDASFRFAVKGI